MGWAGFARCCLLATVAAGGRGSVCAGQTAIEMGLEPSEGNISLKSTSMFTFLLGKLVTLFGQIVRECFCLNFQTIGLLEHVEVQQGIILRLFLLLLPSSFSFFSRACNIS